MRNGITDETRLQQLVYDDLRAETRLGSQHSILASHEAAAALRGIDEIKSLERDYSTSRPDFTADTIKYDSRTMTLFDDESVSLATIGTRIRCELVLPSTDEGYQQQYIDSDEWELTESPLCKRDGEYYLHLSFRRPDPGKRVDDLDGAEDRTVLGVDLGIVNIATTSTAYFASGRELRHRQQEFERIRASMQKTGTKSAYRTLRQIGGRESRYLRDVLHRVANDIVEEAVLHDCEFIAFENLRHIRHRAPPVKQFHKWAHRQLVDMVEYKSKAEGICVEFVAPENTSRKCPECGETSEQNRVQREQFECCRCGTTGNADYVAAKNIGMRYVHRGLQSSRWTGDGQLALKSGTVTASRGPSTADTNLC